MSHGYGEAETVAELALQFGFPGAGTATVAAAGVGQDQQLPTTIVTITAVALPPASDGVDGEGGRVMGDAYEDRAPVGEQVIKCSEVITLVASLSASGSGGLRLLMRSR